MTKTLPIVALAAALAVGGGWFLTQQGTPEGSLLPGAASAQEAGAVDTSTVQDMVQGDPEASVEVIEYASFTCPHCAAFHEDQYQQLRSDYIDTGKIRFVYREIYFDRPGLWASMIARCGGEDRFFDIADTLYSTQRQWLGGDQAQVADNLRQIGLDAGLTSEEIDACMSDATTAQTLVAWFEDNADADGITATPSFVIDGEKYSNMAYDDFAAILDDRLAQ